MDSGMNYAGACDQDLARMHIRIGVGYDSSRGIKFGLGYRLRYGLDYGWGLGSLYGLRYGLDM